MVSTKRVKCNGFVAWGAGNVRITDYLNATCAVQWPLSKDGLSLQMDMLLLHEEDTQIPRLERRMVRTAA